MNQVNTRTRKMSETKEFLDKKIDVAFIETNTELVIANHLPVGAYIDMSFITSIIGNILIQMNDKNFDEQRKKLEIMGVTEEKFRATLDYIYAYDFGDKSYLIDIHDKTRDLMSEETGMFTKMEQALPLTFDDSVKITFEDAVKLATNLINILKSKTQIPVKYSQTIAQFEEKNSSKETFDERTFVILNQIFYQEAGFVIDSELSSEIESIYDSPYTAALIEYPEKVMEINKQLIFKYNVIVEMTAMSRFAALKIEGNRNAIANIIYDTESKGYDYSVIEDVLTSVEQAPVVEENKLIDSIENRKQGKVLSMPERNYNFMNRLSDKIKAGKRMINPKFYLMVNMFEMMDYVSYESPEKFIDTLLEYSVTNTEKSNFLNDIQRLLQKMNSATYNPETESPEPLPFNTFKRVFAEGTDITEEQFLQLVSDKIETVKSELRLKTVSAMNPIDAGIKEKIIPMIVELLKNLYVEDFESKGIVLSLLSNIDELSSKIASYINFIQVVQLIEGGKISGISSHETYKQLNDFISTTNVTVALEENKDTVTLPLIDIFRNSFDTESDEIKIESLKIVKVIFENIK